MSKRVRLETTDSKSVKLKTTKIDFGELKEKATRTPQGKHAAKYDNPYLSITRSMLLNLIEDTEILVKALKRSGLKIERALHYNETEEWKSWVKQGYPDKDIPAFLRKGKTASEPSTSPKRKRTHL